MSIKLCILVVALLLASATISLASEDPELTQCKQQCEPLKQVDKKEAKSCLQKCKDQEKQRRKGGGGGAEEVAENDEREREEVEREGGQTQRRNPYVFEDEHFFTGMQTQHGRLRILQKFTDRSELLRGIENYRVAILEAQPQTFIVPSKGTVSSVLQESREGFNIKERRESFNIKEGDIFRVKAGAGGENPESFYRVFSNEILEAAFNTRSDKLERLLGQQKQGAIIKVSQEQIRAMSAQGEGGIWPFRGESKGTNKHNLYEQRPAHSNQYGQLYEIDSNQFRQLRDFDVAISLANISRGAMTALHYNSRATKIGVVVNGEGYFEMACPHLSQSQGSSRWDESQGRSQGQTRSGTGYQKIQSNLKAGTVVVVPAGHPFVAVASNNQNLQILCFEINAYNNQKYTLAGKSNVMKQLEREAKQLAFGVPAREVDEVFNSQPEEFFFRGPRQGRTTA
ncbi:hypothetical protein ACS0TY_012933 [Phlomoides rotata]